MVKTFEAIGQHNNTPCITHYHPSAREAQECASALLYALGADRTITSDPLSGSRAVAFVTGTFTPRRHPREVTFAIREVMHVSLSPRGNN